MDDVNPSDRVHEACTIGTCREADAQQKVTKSSLMR